MTAPAPAPRVPYFRRMRWWHKWIGIVIGILLVVWLASGVSLIMPMSAASNPPSEAAYPLDWSSVVVSPAQAARIAADSSAGAEVRQVVIHRQMGDVAYVVSMAGGRTALVNAMTGAIERISQERAVSIARRTMPGVPIASTERVTERPLGYHGKVPAYRIAFADDGGTVAVVSETTGELSRTMRRDRIYNTIAHQLHVFAPLNGLPGAATTRKGVLTLTSIIALLSILTGYWLALPRRWRGSAR